MTSKRDNRPTSAAEQRDSGPTSAAESAAGKRDKNGMCHKCDEDHDTVSCPHFKKGRDNHPDALPSGKKKELGGNAGNFVLKNARVVRQPGDGSCLFHSLSFGLGGGSASALRREIAQFVESNADLQIAGTPMSDWVRWDSGVSVSSYARRMAVSGWGGGIEMAACSILKRANIHVYERSSGRSATNSGRSAANSGRSASKQWQVGDT